MVEFLQNGHFQIMTFARAHELPVLVGDIGGTNARFQVLFDRGQEPISFPAVRTSDYENVEFAIQQSVLEKTDHKPKTAILAAAGPITADGLNLTNCHWNIRPDALLDTCSFNNLVLMNDFEAQALSLPFLQMNDLSEMGGDGANTPPNNDHTKIVLGPGTGLGVGQLIRAQGKWIPVAGEGGHVDLGPRTPWEEQVWQHLDKIDGRVSAEQILCGDGLCNAYRACCKLDGAEVLFDQPAKVSAAAIDGSSPQAVAALNLFCVCLGRLAGDLALLSMAKGGAYISGGIAKKILGFLEQSPFRQEFDDKAPHSDLMRQLRSFIVTHELPALVGLIGYARNPDIFSLDIEDRCWLKT